MCVTGLPVRCRWGLMGRARGRRPTARGGCLTVVARPHALQRCKHFEIGGEKKTKGGLY